MQKRKKFSSLLKVATSLLVVLGSVYACQAVAAAGAAADWNSANLGNLAAGVTGSFSGVGQLMIATAYLAGIGFSIGAIFKFKQHRDNPTQVPIGTPLALLIIGIVLIFLPGVIKPVGSTIFGATNSAGGFNGQGANCLPGSTGCAS